MRVPHPVVAEQIMVSVPAAKPVTTPADETTALVFDTDHSAPAKVAV